MNTQDEVRAFSLLETLSRQYRAILGDRLTGLYLHGSLAFGCFRWETSDIDFLVVTEDLPALDEKVRLMRALLALAPSAPPKGLEMSVVLRQECLRFRYPTPFELHYSNAHFTRCQADLAAYCVGMHGVDPDLAAHFTIVRAVGRVLYGKPISSIFGEVPREAYLQSILADVEDAPISIAQEPVYIILNLCRILAYAREGCFLSKAQGGCWASGHLPQIYAQTVSAALLNYEKGVPFAASLESLQSFASFMLERIRLLV